MKQNVGFTLIELLAVIVILIIIALISIPFITQKLDDIKKSSFESNTKIILESILYQMAKDEKFDITKINETNITDYVKTQKVNYKSLSIYNMNNEPYIVALGNGKWENFVAQGTFDNVIVENNIVLWLDGKIQHDLIVKCGVKNIWTDLSGNGNNGSLINFNYNTSSGWMDGLTLDGNDDYFQTKQNLYVDFPLSYEIYFKCHKLDQWNSIISTYEYGENSQKRKGFKLSYLDGNLIISFGDIDTNKNVIIKNNLELEKEYYVSIVFDNNFKKIKTSINGEINTYNIPVWYFPDNKNIRWGSGGIDSLTYPSSISIYTSRVYNRILSNEEMLQNYHGRTIY